MRNRYVVWPLGKASVIFLPDGEEGDRILDLARQWTSESLFGLALWVRGSDVVTEPGRPPLIQGQVFLPDGSAVTQNVLEQLGFQKLDTIRLVAVRGNDSFADSDARQNELVKLVGESIRQSVPEAVMGSENPILTKLQTINLICMPTSLDRQNSGEILQPSWTANIVASPEDSPAPGRVANYVLTDSNYLGFMLAHTAAAAGIWNGVPQSSWDMASRNLDERTMRRGDNAIVQRVFLRGILSRGLTVKVSTSALKAILDPEISSQLLTTHKVQSLREQDVPAYQTKVSSHILNFDDGSGQLGRRTLPPEFNPEVDSVGPLQEILEYFHFLWDIVKVLPYWLVGSLVRAISGRLQKRIGDETESGRRVEASDANIREYGNPLIHHPREYNLQVEITRAELELGRYVLRRSEPMSSIFWRRFRSSILRSLDGQKSNDEFDLDEDWNIDDKRLVFPSTNDVFPNESAPWLVNDDQWVRVSEHIDLEGVEWFRQDRIQEVLGQFDELIQTNNDQILSDSEQLNLFEVSINTLSGGIERAKTDLLVSGVTESELLELEDMEVSASHAELASSPEMPEGMQPLEDNVLTNFGEVEAAEKDDVTTWQFQAKNWLISSLKEIKERRLEIESLTEKIQNNQELADELVSCREQFVTWIERISQTVSVQILDQLEGQKQDLRNEISVSEESMSTLQVEIPKMLKRIRVQYFRKLLVFIGILVAARFAVHLLLNKFLSGIVLQIAERFVNIPVGKYIIYSVIAFLITFLLSTFRFFVQWNKVGNKIRKQILFIDWNIEAVRLLRADLKRIEDTEEHARKWLTILQFNTSKPWTIASGSNAENTVRFETGELPACVCIADAVTSESSPAFRGLFEAALDFNTQPGWREKSLRTNADEVFRRILHIDIGGGLERLERDISDSRSADKALMLENMTNESVLIAVGEKYILDTESYCREIEISANRPKVTDLKPNPLLALQGDTNAGELEWDEFYRPLQGRASQFASTCFSQSGLIEGAGGRPISFISGPERLAPVFKDTADAEYAPSDHRGIGEFESMLRIDFTDPIPLNHLSIVIPLGADDPQDLTELRETIQVCDDDDSRFA
jgi:hypothetical protein